MQIYYSIKDSSFHFTILTNVYQLDIIKNQDVTLSFLVIFGQKTDFFKAFEQ
jgi:hypothetical protein